MGVQMSRRAHVAGDIPELSQESMSLIDIYSRSRTIFQELNYISRSLHFFVRAAGRGLARGAGGWCNDDCLRGRSPGNLQVKLGHTPASGAKRIRREIRRSRRPKYNVVT
jgi:hypothetical protein